MNRSVDEPAHPHPAPREEVPARAPTLGQSRTCARTDKWTLGTAGIVPKNHSLDKQSSKLFLQPTSPGRHHLQSREDSCSEDQAPRPHAAEAAEGGREGACLAPKKRERVTVQALGFKFQLCCFLAV